jgi:hypothetical protein
VRRKCPAITSKGEACQAFVHEHKTYCPAHDPERAHARKVAASKAGSQKKSEVVEVKRQLRRLVKEVLEGGVERADAAVCAQLLGVWLRACDTQRKERELEELLVRIEELEAAAGRGPPYGG